MATYLIPSGTAVEAKLDGETWRTVITTKPMEFSAYQAMGIGKFTFRTGDWQLRVECDQVKGTWGKKP